MEILMIVIIIIPEYGDEENKHVVVYDRIEVDQAPASALG